MSKKTILVPTDFTSVARTAMEHAVNTAQVAGAKVVLLNVVEDNKHVDEAKSKLNKEKAVIDKSDSDVEVETVVRIGNIFDDIGDVAAELDAVLIFMGTHGAKGWQKIVGSHAMRVITHSDVPFIVVQDRGISEGGYDDIVVPLDLHKETKQKLNLVANMAKYFNSKVHLITPKETDEFLHNQLERNIHFAKQYLGERDIEFTTTTAEKGDFDDQIIDHAKNVNADLITIMNLHGNSLMGMGLLGSKYEQHIITNKEQIPVLIVNPHSTTVAGGNAGIFY